MPPIRVLIVDDSVVIRKILSDALETDRSIVVAGSAPDGRIALSKIPQINPDLITLDVEMPGMDGLETLAEIHKLYPKLPVIMFSTLTERGASTTLTALSLGALDYATKPSNTGSREATVQRIQAELIPKIKALCGVPRFSAVPIQRVLPRATPGGGFGQRVDILAIGTSTGGPNALAVVLPAIPRDFPVPIVIVQHMPPLFTRLLADRLNGQSQIAVREAVAGMVIEPGTAWIARGDFHMTVERADTTVRLLLNQNEPENSCRPAVDPLFRSVAATYGAHALGVVLTGMGSDGVRGSGRIREANGQVIVQDEATSVVWGMPGQVAEAGYADAVYSLDMMAPEIVGRVKKGRWASAAGFSVKEKP